LKNEKKTVNIIEVGSPEFTASLIYDHLAAVFATIHMFPECAPLLNQWIGTREEDGLLGDVLDDIHDDSPNRIALVHRSDALKSIMYCITASSIHHAVATLADQMDMDKKVH
jgi:hypothetical protein